MTQNLETSETASDSTVETEKSVAPEEIAELIQEFEKYRQRLIDEMTTAAKKAKLPKSKVMTKLEPQLAEIDAKLENLRAQHAAMTGN